MSASLSLMRRIRFTPWQDILRLRITGRLDWRAIVDRSGLPEDIGRMIRDVLGGARLTRSEKASVATELVAHFQDGFEAGQSWHQLTADFGDADILSRLIRNAKHRNRSMIVKLIKVLGGASALTAGAGLIWLILFLGREAGPPVDYVPQLNVRALAASATQQAWPVYRESWIRHRFVEWDQNWETNAVRMSLETVRPGDPGWDSVLEILDQRADLVEALRRGARLPSLGIVLRANMHEYSDLDQQALFPQWYEQTPADQRQNARNLDDQIPAGGVMGVLLPHSQALRTAGRLLMADARRALEQGGTQRAIENIDLTFGLAWQASEPACLVSALVGYAIADLGFEQLNELLRNHQQELSDDDLERLKQIVARQDFRQFIQLDGERVMLPDVLQACYTDDGNGDGRITKQGLEMMTGLVPSLSGESSRPGFDVLWALLFSSRKEIEDAFDRWFDFAEPVLDRAWYEASFSGEALIDEIAEPGTAERWLLDTLIPAVDAVRSSLQTRLARQEAAATALALIQFRRQRGVWPNALNELVPRYLERVPVDRLNGQPIHYRLDPEPVVYSVGPDGDDDGGSPLVDAHGQPRDWSSPALAEGLQGDWILWPLPAEPND